MNILLLPPTLLVLGGCASSYTPPTLPADHPANPAAMGAPPPERSRTLDVTAAEPADPARAGEPMGQAGHGMGDSPKPDALAPPGADAAALFACPMHPEVTSDKPDQRCPKCGMKLKPMSKEGGTR